MDSMRSLNSSLPSSRPNRSAPPEDLLQAFRSAALSVTNLYKSAATNQANARQAGYQDALEDLLKFLDRENLGLQDGEGWRVRQWATARYDGGTTQPEEDEVDEEHSEAGNATTEPAQEEEDNTAIIQERLENSASTARQESEEDSDSAEQPTVFQFTSNSRPDNNMQTDESNSPQAVDERPSSAPGVPIRVEVLNRNNRPSSRPHSRHTTRSNPREFTFTAGSKRKMHFPDFFDISSLNDKRDGFGGGGGPKRGRIA